MYINSPTSARVQYRFCNLDELQVYLAQAFIYTSVNFMLMSTSDARTNLLDTETDAVDPLDAILSRTRARKAALNLHVNPAPTAEIATSAAAAATNISTSSSRLKVIYNPLLSLCASFHFIYYCIDRQMSP